MGQQLVWFRPRAGEWTADTGDGSTYRVRPMGDGAAGYRLEFGRLESLMVELGTYGTPQAAQNAGRARFDAARSGELDPRRDVYQQRVRELRDERTALAAPAEACQPLVDDRVHDVYLAALRVANLPEPTPNVRGGYSFERKCTGIVALTGPNPHTVELTVYSSGGSYLWSSLYVDAPASVVGELLVRMVTT